MRQQVSRSLSTKIRQKIKTHYSDEFIKKVIGYQKRFGDPDFFQFNEWIYGQLKHAGERRRTFLIPVLRKWLPSNDCLLLDLGCGLGASTVVYSYEGYQAIGIDIGRDEVKIAGMRAKEDEEDCQFIVADARRLPFRNDFFDVCMCVEVIEHVPKGKEKVIQEAYRVTKKSGIIEIETPNKLYLKDFHDTNLYFINYLPRKIAYFYARLRNRMPKSGLSSYVTFFYLKKVLNRYNYKILGDILGYDFDDFRKYYRVKSRKAQVFMKLCKIPRFELIVRAIKVFLPCIYLTLRKE